MKGTAKAVLAAAWLACGSWTALAADNEAGSEAQSGQWLKAGDCQLFNADAKAGDTVSWTGACVEGYASGLGTATFTQDGKTQSFTATFARGMIPDGGVVARWGEGWSYEGGMAGGRFHGAGILTTDTNDRFEGQWVDGKMNGFGVLRRANGERYAGDWKDDKPNGPGELRQPDGALVAGTFVEGKLTQASNAPSDKTSDKTTDKALAAKPSASAPFGAVSGKTLTGVDGSSIALNVIEGGMELQVMPADGNTRKATFTFMTDRMGTVVEDSGVSGAGTSVTGFFRLTAKGVEVRYADGRSAMLSSNGDGVQMTLESEAGASCRSWYPPGHVFSETDKKAALNAYASRLGLPVAAGETGGGCSSPVTPVAMGSAPPVSAAPEKRSEAKAARVAKASYRIGDFKGLEAVSVRTAPVRPVDGAPSVSETVAAIAPPESIKTSGKTVDKDAASSCLKVDSDGGHWGFRNDCDFAVQFAYCMAGDQEQTSPSLAACEKGAVAGSVAAHGFGALSADNSLKESDANHSFRWIACGGGAGEVVAHLDRFEPPAGRCERTRTASVN